MNPRLKKVLNAIKHSAKSEGIKTHEVSAADLWKHNNDLTAHDLKVLGGLESVKKAFFPISDKELAAMSKIKKENKYVSKLETRIGEKEAFHEDFIATLDNRLGLLKVKEYSPKSKEKKKRVLNLVLSDLHIGSDIKKDETGHAFGVVEESRRLANIVKQVIEYKEQYRNETHLELLMLGDMFQGQLHDPRDGATIAEQIARALHILAQAIGQFSANFKSVSVRCTSGNHGRNTARHKDRAVNEKWDSLETILYTALKQTCKGLKNVEFDIPKTPYLTYEVFGKKIFATHGDTVLNPGYPNKSINIKNLEGQVNKINASLKDKDEYEVFIVGHIHTGSTTYLSNGSVMLTNGAMVPPDAYAISIGLIECQTGQMLFESTEGYAFGDSRFIRVGPENDKDKSLDKIISPWENL